VDILYDYLRLLGDKKWTAPLPGNVRPLNASSGTMPPGASTPTPAVVAPASNVAVKPRSVDTRRRP
jgi:hypothetical protein